MARVSSVHDSDKIGTFRGVWEDAFLQFIKWSQGKSPLDDALNALAVHLGADAVCLSRRDREGKRNRVVQIFDRRTNPTRPELQRSFADAALGPMSVFLRPGTTARLSDNGSASHRDPHLDSWMVRRGVTDIGFVCLGSENGILDTLEFHFTTNVDAVWATRTKSIGRMLADVYEGKRDGLIEQHIVRKSRRPNRAAGASSSILSPDNPAGLTRTEWRLCGLVACGLSREGAAAELDVTLNTMRTHLRNIYAKTGCETFHELALRLVSPEEQRHLPKTFEVIAA